MMYLRSKILNLVRDNMKPQCIIIQKKCYHRVPFVELYEKTTDEFLSQDQLSLLKKKHMNIDTLSRDHLQRTVEILKKFNISALEACKDPHVFCMNHILMDNYGEILKECGFVKIIPKYIIRYHTLVRSRTIQQLKKESLMESNNNLLERLLQCFDQWDDQHKIIQTFSDVNSTILTIRLFVLEKYLNWRLNVTPEDFQKYCRVYLPIKHRPMSDIQKALLIAKDEIGFSDESIRRNGFLISADPVNTKLILEKVPSVAGLDVRETIRVEPAMLKSNYTNIMEIRSILDEYRISDEAQRSCLKVYCMCPKTVRERLEELVQLKEYQVLKTNPRVLSMVVHKRKIESRLGRLRAANKPCYSLNHLISANNIFNNYIGSFGSKICSRDIAILICNSLNAGSISSQDKTETLKLVQNRLKRHKFWMHTALNIVHENIELLKKWFDGDVIFNNCQLLFYPVSDVEQHIKFFLRIRNTKGNRAYSAELDIDYNNLEFRKLSDDQILSLILYEIEKKYHFSGDGIWSKMEGNRVESQVN